MNNQYSRLMVNISDMLIGFLDPENGSFLVHNLLGKGQAFWQEWWDGRVKMSSILVGKAGQGTLCKGWKVYNPVTKAVSVARDVVFDETDFPGLSTKGASQAPPATLTIRSLWPEGTPIEDEAPPAGNPPDGDGGDKAQAIPPDTNNADVEEQENSFPGDYEDTMDDDNLNEDAAQGPTTPMHHHNDPAPHTPLRERKPFDPTLRPVISPTPKPDPAHIDEASSDEDETATIPPPQFPPPPPPHKGPY
ncbi:hypothetical protein DFP72DRAFT_842369 [Ephemerocybe angulata]|uniref:Retroviral polymerase SH3-like domain-containing protein n=1 Tax=Ephemerocybe angulata TaxID=980116 RepID=A0A8H6IBJ3_9AGAR|nr:hypothetical protein DFP72DRAFT_842369 [Tulosesus angulatus]